MSWNDLRKGRYSQSNGEYFITFCTQDRVKLFSAFDLAQLFCQQIAENEKRYHCTWITWVLMPDHFHGLLRLESTDFKLSSIVGSLKGQSSYLLNKRLKRKGKIWQSSFYDRALRVDDDRVNVARYIVANPQRKGLVKNVRDYPYWNSIYL